MKLAAFVSISLLNKASSSTEEGVVGSVLDSSTVNRIVSSRLTVQIPHSLFREGGYDHHEAHFGIPPYRGSLAENVYYADQDMCDVIVDTTKGFPSRPNNDAWPSPYILLIDRGDCTFVQKVRNAQRSGATGVVIADNLCLCSDTECDTPPDGLCQTQEPMIADDGSGADISIPSFLMFKKDADKVKEELKSNRPVRIEMAWRIPNPYNYVEYDLWTTPGDKISTHFFSDFGPVVAALGKRAHFTPRMYIYDGIRSHCRGNYGKSSCRDLCTNEGRYCAARPRNELENSVSGADVVRESLRRLCIWSRYGNRDEIGTAWWEYVHHFHERCENSDLFTDIVCIKNAMEEAKVDWEEVEECMRNSGGTENDWTNAILEKELSSQMEQGVVIIPTASVNSIIMRGALTVNNVFHAICSGFRSGTEPDICNICSGCLDTATCVQKGRCANNQCTDDGSTSLFPMLTAGLLGGIIGVAIWHSCKLIPRMHDNTKRMALNGYTGTALDDQDVDK